MNHQEIMSRALNALVELEYSRTDKSEELALRSITELTEALKTKPAAVYGEYRLKRVDTGEWTEWIRVVVPKGVSLQSLLPRTLARFSRQQTEFEFRSLVVGEVISNSSKVD